MLFLGLLSVRWGSRLPGGGGAAKAEQTHSQSRRRSKGVRSDSKMCGLKRYSWLIWRYRRLNSWYLLLREIYTFESRHIGKWRPFYRQNCCD